MEKVSRKEAMHATLKARRSFLGSSTASSSSRICCSSSRTVGKSLLLFGSSFSFFSLSMEPELGVAVRDGALIKRVVSQLKGSGLASETDTVTMSPIMMAARFPAKVGYSTRISESALCGRGRKWTCKTRVRSRASSCSRNTFATQSQYQVRRISSNIYIPIPVVDTLKLP